MTALMDPPVTLVPQYRGKKERAGQWSHWSGSIPIYSNWEIGAVKEVLQTAALQPNWDSYGSPPPTEMAIINSVSILINIPKIGFDDLQIPFIAPVPGGGIQLEWTIGRRELEVEIMPDGSIEYLKAEDREPLEEGRLEPTMGHLRSLIAWLTSAR